MRDDNFGDLGFYSLGLNYGCFGLFSFLSAPIVKKWGAKRSIIIGCLTYCIFIGAFILPCLSLENPRSKLHNMHNLIYAFLMISAAITGFGGSILWVA